MKHTACYREGYPRPQFVREWWQSLDGEWDFAFDDSGEGESKGFTNGDFSGRKILVPFSYESPLSGIGDETMHPCVWYKRTVDLSETGNLLLNFEGSDYHTKVWLNGAYVGENYGGYHRFTFPVGAFAKKGKNLLVVKVEDDYCSERPRGKQRWQDGVNGCWYVQTTGIYKSVWLERVDETYLQTLKITPDVTNASVRFEFSAGGKTDGVSLETEISFAGKTVAKVETAVSAGTNGITVPLTSAAVTYKCAHWTPGNPDLYDVVLRLKRKGCVLDKVGSYFGLRSVEVKDGKILLNEVPVVMKLLLDQGYFEGGHLTADSGAALLRDAELIKEMGYNGVRKHQKTEDERFLYYADILGLFVWCEMPSAYWYSDKSVQETTEEWGKIVTQNYSHPCLAVWVPLNESWGVTNIATNKAQQNFANALYYYTKAFDPMRPVISNDGWEHTKSDILTIHHYEQDADKLCGYYDTLEKAVCGNVKNNAKLPFAEGYKYEGQPIIFSEYGGTALSTDTDGWGYGYGVPDGEALLTRYEKLTAALMSQPYASGFCYTQLTDVQQEVNGLLTPARKNKVDIQKLKAINDKY